MVLFLNVVVISVETHLELGVGETGHQLYFSTCAHRVQLIIHGPPTMILFVLYILSPEPSVPLIHRDTHARVELLLNEEFKKGIVTAVHTLAHLRLKKMNE